jgi:hypothetical protein
MWQKRDVYKIFIYFLQWLAISDKRPRFILVKNVFRIVHSRTCKNIFMSVKSSTELMLYVVSTMPTLNKAYLFIYYLKHEVRFVYIFRPMKKLTQFYIRTWNWWYRSDIASSTYSKCSLNLKFRHPERKSYLKENSTRHVFF